MRLNTVIQTLGAMLDFQIALKIRLFFLHISALKLDFRKAKILLLAICVFYAFLKSRNIPRVWITVSKHGNLFGNS